MNYTQIEQPQYNVTNFVKDNEIQLNTQDNQSYQLLTNEIQQDKQTFLFKEEVCQNMEPYLTQKQINNYDNGIQCPPINLNLQNNEQISNTINNQEIIFRNKQSASANNGYSKEMMSNLSSFAQTAYTPFSKSNSTKNYTQYLINQNSNQGYERFIPSRNNSKMLINFQSKDSLDQQLQQSLTKQTNNVTDPLSSIQDNNNIDNNISIASLFQKHVLDTKNNQKILNFSGNKNSCQGSNHQKEQNFSSYLSKVGLYSQQFAIEQENINDEDFFKNPANSYKTQAMKSKIKQQLVITDSTKILDAPGLEDDYYLNLLNWSAQNIISVVLKNEVFGYNCSTRKIFCLQKQNLQNNYKFTSVKFSKSGKLLAVGNSLGGVQILDAETRREVSFFQNHLDRVASLSWINDDMLASGSKDCNVICQDIRDKNIVRKYSGHSNEVCGLEWSCDQQTLASGGNDDKLFVWNIGYNQHQYKFSEHKAAVKALTWSPHQHGLLVSGGGSRDKTIRFWNIHTGKQIECIETNSQVCNLAFTKNTNQFVSTHGFVDNEIYVWKYPRPQKVKIFQGHQKRVIYMALSPDSKQIVTGSSDETLRFWDAFPDLCQNKAPESILKFSDLR